MTIDQLIILLDSVEDKSIEVVFRTGNNHGANKVTKTSRWNAYPNPNSGHFEGACDCILPDNPNYRDAVPVLVLS